MRSFLIAGAIVLGAAAASAQHGHSVSGRAPVGATGPAPTGGVGSLIHAPSVHSGAGYRGSSAAFTSPYRSAYTNGNRYGNRGGTGHYGRGRRYAAVPFFYGTGYVGGPDYFDYGDYAESPYAAAPIDTPTDPLTQHYEVQENMLGSEINQLHAEIDDLRAQRETAEPMPPYRAPDSASEAPASPPVTVVLRNGQRFQSSNYAVMDNTFWDFSKSPMRRVPMADVNIPASVEASAAAGAQFPE